MIATLPTRTSTPELTGDLHNCPLQGQTTAFQLVDEHGDGTSYAGLRWEAIDSEGQHYNGKLGPRGNGEINNHFCGVVILSLTSLYSGGEQLYERLLARESYPLPITELQVCAEQTYHANKDGERTTLNRALDPDELFWQVEVSDLVRHAAHLPPKIAASFPAQQGANALFFHAPSIELLSKTPGAQRPCGLALMPNKKHILEVRPLRALRPLFSTDNQFCALNLYQLALMSTLSYTPFGQSPDEHPVTSQQVGFPHQPTSGNWFGDALAKFEALSQVDAGQPSKPAYHPLLEDVPYSKRLEILPFDPELYPEVNSASLGKDQETPASLHFFDDTDEADPTNTQAFLSHNDEVVLIAIRGSAQLADFIRDADAEQAPFKGGGRVHNGFHGATQALEAFVTTYLDKFHTNQKLLITGHSLGGAIALLLSEVLRRRQNFTYDITLYTYGAPRAADTTFIEGAAGLTHHRMVNHDDPVPSVPAPWMNTSSRTYGSGAVLAFVNVPVGMSLFAAGLVNTSGDPYGHHGTLHHFMPVTFEDKHQSSILWNPGCDTITQHACARALQQTDGLPERAPLLGQILRGSNHSMVSGYIPNCWATLRRWQEACEGQRGLVTTREFEWVDRALKRINQQLDNSPQWGSRAMQERRDEWEQTLRSERRKVEATQQRLATLRSKTVTQSDVYGSLAAQPDVLANALARWNAHPDNNTAHQLAMAPPLVMSDEEAIATLIGGHVIGAPCTFDIDSIT